MPELGSSEEGRKGTGRMVAVSESISRINISWVIFRETHYQRECLGGVVRLGMGRR